MFATTLLRLFAVLLLIAANAFFVAAEFALVSVRNTRIQQLVEAGRLGARTVQKLHSQLETLLSAVQLGVTLASLALGWIGEPALAWLFEGWLGKTGMAVVASHALAITVAFALITYFHVILGEVVPKSVALQRADRVALAVAGPMDVFITIARPFLATMRKTTTLVLKMFGIRQIREGSAHSPEELKMLISGSHRLGMMPEYQEELVIRALDLGNITVREIMVPRPRIFSLPANMTLRDALAPVTEEQHSRVPVYDHLRGPEYIIGLLYSKDMSRWARLRLSYSSSEWAQRLDRMQVKDIMRTVLVVPETKPITDLLQEFKKSKRHLAIVVDEFGSTAGVVTVEDVLEQLVGEIEDEFDISLTPLAPGTTTMELDGTVPIRDLDTAYHLRLPRDQGFETLAGFMLAQLQRLPAVGDSVDYDGRKFTVIEMDNHRVAKVKIETSATRTVNSA